MDAGPSRRRIWATIETAKNGSASVMARGAPRSTAFPFPAGRGLR
jgi:hypothetical protein